MPSLPKQGVGQAPKAATPRGQEPPEPVVSPPLPCGMDLGRMDDIEAGGAWLLLPWMDLGGWVASKVHQGTSSLRTRTLIDHARSNSRCQAAGHG